MYRYICKGIGYLFNRLPALAPGLSLTSPDKIRRTLKEKGRFLIFLIIVTPSILLLLRAVFSISLVWIL